jgi:multiple sugar transport system substrate-binding protein
MTIWHASAPTSDAGKALDALLGTFHEQFPAITPDRLVASTNTSNNFEKLQIALTGGQAPDVMSTDVIWPAALVARNALRPLDAYLKQVAGDGPKREDYFEGPLEACTVGGKTYSLPYETGGLLLFYNQNLFKEVGLDAGTALATWDSFVDAAKRLTKRSGTEYERMGFLIPRASQEWRVYTWGPFLWQNGGEFVDKTGKKSTFNEPPGVEAAQFWVDLVQRHQVTALQQPAGLFDQGLAGMYIQGVSEITRLKKANLNFPFGTAVLPKKKSAASNTGGWTWGISAEGKNPDAAWQWVEWSGRVPQLVRWSLEVGQLPPRKSARDTKEWKDLVAAEPAWKAALDTLAIQRARPQLARYTEWSPLVADGLENAVSGKAPAKQALDEAARQADQLL